MPYSVRRNFGSCSGYAVVKDGTSKIMGCHTSREKARSQITALNMSEGGYKPYHDDEEEDKPYHDEEDKAKVRHGDFVSYSTDKGRYVGEVYDIITSGNIAVVTSEGGTETVEATEDKPVARINIFVDNEDGTFTRSDRRVPVKVSMLRPRGKPKVKQLSLFEEVKVSAKVKASLKKKLDEHNEKYGDNAAKRTTMRALTAVFNRGVGAYRTNPGSVRPTVTSADQWAHARVNSFLYALRNGRFRRGKHDQDLLPASHPMSSKKGKGAAAMEGYATREAAEERARQIGCTGAHEMPDGMGFMPCSTHAAYERVTGTGGENPKPSGGYAKDHQDNYKPTRGMVSAAKRGLELREAQPPSNRGGTAVGLARARDIVNGKNLSLSSVKRMYSFFSRHEVDKQAEGFRPGEDGYPSRGLQAWLLWGGDSGFSWSRKIVEHEKRKEEKGDAIFGPSGRIILQDLNVALSSNFKEMQKNRPMTNFVENVEEYRQWIVELLKHEHVILVTARSVGYEELTLNRINDQTGWQPNDWCFNPWADPSGKGALRAHRAKERYLTEYIFPKYGDDPNNYFAIESNKYSRSMYRSYGIECRDANRDDSQPWKSLLP